MNDKPEKLSIEARCVAAAWFGMMGTVETHPDSELRFGMVESRPSAKAQAGLDELVRTGYISRENEKSGAVVYRPLKNCHPFLVPMMKASMGMGRFPKGSKFPLTEPMTAPSQAGETRSEETEKS
jgi:hypothetical protein